MTTKKKKKSTKSKNTTKVQTPKQHQSYTCKHPIFSLIFIVGSVMMGISVLWSMLPPFSSKLTPVSYLLYGLSYVGFAVSALTTTYIALRIFFHFEATHHKQEQELHIRQFCKDAPKFKVKA